MYRESVDEIVGVLDDDPAKAKAQLDRVAKHHGMSAPPTAIVGSPDQIAEKIAGANEGIVEKTARIQEDHVQVLERDGAGRGVCRDLRERRLFVGAAEARRRVRHGDHASPRRRKGQPREQRRDVIALRTAPAFEHEAAQCPACGRLSVAGGACPLDGTEMELREDGFPIGSGMVESGCKQFRQRFSGPGMQWSRPGIERLLPIRAAIMSQRFDQLWKSAYTSPLN